MSGTDGELKQPESPTFKPGGAVTQESIMARPRVHDFAPELIWTTDQIAKLTSRIDSLVSCIVMTAEANALLLTALAVDADESTAEQFVSAAKLLWSAIEEAVPST